MQNGEFATLKRLKRELEYTELTKLLGKVVKIESIDDVESSVRSVVLPLVPAVEEMDSLDLVKLVFNKYRILDLKFRVRGMIECDRPGLKLLREVGLLISKEDEATLPFTKGNSLEFVLEDLNSKSYWLKLFLMPVNETLVKRREEGGFVVEQCLPAEFAIRDACLTNLPMIWFMKHFYM